MTVLPYLPPDGKPMTLVERPLLASWDAKTHPSQIKLRAYLDHMRRRVTLAIANAGGAVGLTLDVGLGPAADLLHQRDLDNFLQPVADALPTDVCSYWTTKSHAVESTVTVGPARDASAGSLTGWAEVSVATAVTTSGSDWKHAINDAVAQTAVPAPDGPLELQLTFAVAPGRNWRTLWKPAIDALDPILGRTDPQRPFHPRDDRIIRLGLHRRINPALGRRTELHVHWRASGDRESVAARPTGSSTAPAPPAPRAGSLAYAAPTMSVIEFRDDDNSYLNWVAANHGGYVINIPRTLNPAEARLHHASCRTIAGENPRGGPWTGQWIKVCAETIAALDDWATQTTSQPIRRCGTCQPENA
jgi:hypothetical protein